MARAGTAEDLPRLIALLSMPSVAAGYFGAPGTVTLASDTLARNLARAGQGGGEVWVGCASAQPASILAYAALIDGTLAYLVDPAWQGNGVASALARWTCDRAFEKRPASAIAAVVFRENAASVAVLERLGFRFTGLSWPTIVGCHHARAMLGFTLDPRRGSRPVASALNETDAISGAVELRQ